MRTLIVVAIGLVLAVAFVVIANLINKSKGEMFFNGFYVFAVLWFIFCAVDYYYGVFRAGYGAMEELGIHLVIFLVPVAIAFFVSRSVNI